MPTAVEPMIRISPGILDQLSEQIETPWVVILFNDECHSVDEVVLQLQKATGCTEERAEAVMLEAHTTGRAVAFEGTLEECERVTAILKLIELEVEIERA